MRGRWIGEIPEHGGRWEFRISQQYQLVEIEANAGAERMTVLGARLRGEDVRIVANGLVRGRAWNQSFRGTLSGNTMAGEVRVSDGQQVRVLPWKASRQR